MLSPVVIFPSINRPQMLHESVLSVVKQSVPSRILVSVPGKEHVSPETLALPGVELVLSPRGLCAQRNTALRQIADRDTVIFFFDDDVEVERRYVEEMLLLFEQRPTVSLASGINVGLGAPAGTLTRDTAKSLIQSKLAQSPETGIIPVRSVIGCKMCFRGSLMGSVQFDERLPLYAYMEDFDFSLQCKKHGELVLNRACLMVHIETAEGRMGSRRRGFSEIVNPFYIYKKKIGAGFTRTIVGSLRRTLRSARGYADPGGRDQLRGNLIGWTKVITGRVDPEYMLKL